jgi:hypothetical protein
MRKRATRLVIAFVLTVTDVAIFNWCAGDIWQVLGQSPLAQLDLIALLILWISSAAVIWFHITNDVRQTLRELNPALSQDASREPSELRRDSDV